MKRIMQRMIRGVTVMMVILVAGYYSKSYGDSPITISSLTAGANHTCALFSIGTVKCWGFNFFGQLGDGSTVDTYTPVKVAGISSASAISAGAFHTCAMLSDGTVLCWGQNSAGVLGNGTTKNSANPVAVTGLFSATAIASGGTHTCVVLSDRTVQCWGSNGNGQLGVPVSTDYSTVPVIVPRISTATAVASGLLHTCALLSDGTIQCWGHNGAGQLGTGSTAIYSAVPATVIGISSATAIAAGQYHTCAILSDLTMKCWGGNFEGQLGNGTTIDSSVPVIVTGISTAIAVTAGSWYTCALLTDGTIKCWGAMSSYQPEEDRMENSSTAVVVPGISSATAIAAGWVHTCASLSHSTVKCWGGNNSIGGKFSKDKGVNVDIPVKIEGLF